jgi:Peptidase family M23
VHRFLAIGLAVVFSLAVCGEAAAWSWPADGAVLRPFTLGADAYAGGQHRGVDVGGPDGSAVRAPASGVISFAGSLPTYGRGVTILTADGYAVTLVHLGTIGVAKGDTVSEGATVGTMGASGTPEQSVPSVHLGIRRASEEEGYVDPLGLLPPRGAAAPTSPPATAPSPAPVQAAPPVVTPQAPPPTAPPVSSSPPPSIATPTAPSAPAAPPVAPPVAAAPAAEATADVDGGAAPGDEVAVEASAPGLMLSAPAARARPASPAHALVAAEGPTDPAVHASARRAPIERPVRTAGSGPASAVGSGTARARERAPGGVQDDAPARPGRVTRAHVGAQAPARGASARLVETANALEPTSPHPAQPVAPGTARGPNRAGAARLSAGVANEPSASPAIERPPSGIRLPELAVALALAVIAAVAVGRRVARRIGVDGAVLRHYADLLRQLDAAHRARIHHRGRGRVRAPSAAARS